MKPFQWQPYLNETYNSVWKKIIASTKLSGSRAATMTEARRGVMPEHDITWKDLKSQYALQHGRCYWSGVPLQLENQSISYHPLAVSVDRIANEKGYHKDNIVLTARLINLGKNQYPSDAFPTVMEQFKEGIARKWWQLWK